MVAGEDDRAVFLEVLMLRNVVYMLIWFGLMMVKVINEAQYFGAGEQCGVSSPS